MKTYFDLTDIDIEECISGDLLSVQQIRSILEEPGIIVDNIINEELFSRRFNAVRDAQGPDNDNTNWPCGYLTANDLQDLLNG